MGGALRTLVLASASLLAMGGPAFAQQAVSPEAASVEELIVTAQRREQSIQSVPASITAYGQSSIQALSISNAGDITRLTPGLAITRSDGLAGSTSISIRGISSFVGTAPTAVYIDDTPIQVRFLGAGQAAGTAYPAVFDLERIEVLRGPQGTLFGASSEGGTIRFITAQPGLQGWRGHARVEGSSIKSGGEGYQVGVAAGGALVEEKLGLRVSAYAQREAGWVDRRPFGGGRESSDANFVETQALSAALLWRPTEDLSITPSVFWQKQEAGSNAFYWRDLSDPADGRFVSGQLVDAPSKDEFVLSAVKVEWDFGDVSLISNTSYLDHKLDASRDYTFGITEILTGDYLGPNAPTTSYFSNPQKQFTQEVRLQGESLEGRLSWVAGVFYQNALQVARQRAVSPTMAAYIQNLFGVPIELALGSPVLPGDVVYSGYDRAKDIQLAGFAQIDFKVTPQLTLTAGIRQARSKYEFSNAQDGPFNGGPTQADGSATQNDTLPKFGVTYEPNDDLRLYATVAKGFRPGGANVPVPGICGPDLALVGRTSGPETYRSDTVWSYEAGAKGEALGNRLVWDASAYRIRWRSIQSSVYLPRCGFSYIDNLGEAESRGFDLQARVEPARGLSIQVGVSYTDAEYTKTIPSAAGNLVTDGERLATPPWHVSLAVDYVWDEAWRGFRPYVHADNQYSAGYHTNDPANALYNPVRSRNGATNVFAARVGLKNETVDLSLFAKNLFDAHPLVFTNYSLGSSLFMDTSVAPRTVGVTLTSTF